MISRRKLLLAVLAAVTAAPSGSDTSGRMVLLSGIEILAAVVARRLQRQRERNRERWTRCREKRGGYTRRKINRADGEWMASTMSGYVRLDQYDDVYAKNFRVSRATFDVLLGQLQRGGCLRDNQSRNPLHQVPGRFKLGVMPVFLRPGHWLEGCCRLCIDRRGDSAQIRGRFYGRRCASVAPDLHASQAS